jgi:hypothetical protein
MSRSRSCISQRRSPACRTCWWDRRPGAYPLQDLWVDSIGGVWRCTVAGTPGTWVQLHAAIVAAFPGGAVAGYRVIRTDLNYAEFYYDGAAWQGVYVGAVHTEGNGAPGGATPGFSYVQLDGAPRSWWLKAGGAWVPMQQV